MFSSLIRSHNCGKCCCADSLKDNEIAYRIEWTNVYAFTLLICVWNDGSKF